MHDARTLSLEDHLQGINLLAAVFSFAEKVIDEGGRVLRYLFSGLDVESKPKNK